MSRINLHVIASLLLWGNCETRLPSCRMKQITFIATRRCSHISGF